MSSLTLQCYRHVALREIHCIPTERGRPAVNKDVTQGSVGWGEAIMPLHFDINKYQGATEKLLTVSGWMQSWVSGCSKRVRSDALVSRSFTAIVNFMDLIMMVPTDH